MKKPSLKNILDALYQTIHAERLGADPLHVVRQFSDHADQEVAGFMAALLAVGRADLIIQAVKEILRMMENSPAQFVRRFDPTSQEKYFDGFVYRFYKGRDIGLLVSWMKQMFDQSGSIENFFMEGFDPTDDHIGPALSRFVQKMGALNTAPFYDGVPPHGSGARHWLTDPDQGSGCKRMNLFLRWMVRSKDIDLGLWRGIPSSKLIIPLDTYIARMGRRLGLTSRKSADWRMAVEITESLRQFDPDDPIKYDFVLCHAGMVHQCPVEEDFSGCSACPFHSFCLQSVQL